MSESKSQNQGAKLSEPEGRQNQAAREKRHHRRMRALRSFLLKLFSLALVLYVLLFHLVGIMTMPNGDMYPRIDAGDLILFYRLERNIKAQDIVVIDKAVNEDLSTVSLPEAGEMKAEKPWWRRVLTFLKVPDPEEPKTTRFVCRVVAAPGDTVEIADGTRLVINGNSMIESGIFYTTTEYLGFVDYPITLGENEYFVLADYRNGGADSRFFGPVTAEEIQGVVITIMRRNNL